MSEEHTDPRTMDFLSLYPPSNVEETDQDPEGHPLTQGKDLRETRTHLRALVKSKPTYS